MSLFLWNDKANPDGNKSAVYLSHDVQRAKLLLRWQLAQGAVTCIKVSFMSFHFQIFIFHKSRTKVWICRKGDICGTNLAKRMVKENLKETRCLPWGERWTTERWLAPQGVKRATSKLKTKIKYESASLIRGQRTMETSWVNNWDGVCITLCLHSKRGTQPFNTAASITPHQENDVPLDPINKIILRTCVCVHERACVGT